jgi:hypothetical protein
MDIITMVLVRLSRTAERKKVTSEIVQLNFDLLVWGMLRDLTPFFQNWILLVLYSFCCIPLGHWGATTNSKFAFYLCCGLYVVAQLLIFAYSGYIVNAHSPRFAMPLAIGYMAEQSRISMKMHSYFREKVLCKRYKEQYSSYPKVKGHLLGFALPEKNYITGEILRFAEYLFMPTLVYRECYPRTARIRWDYVVMRGLELVGLVYYAFLIFRVSLPALEATAGHPISFTLFWRLSFSCM